MRFDHNVSNVHPVICFEPQFLEACISPSSGVEIIDSFYYIYITIFLMRAFEKRCLVTNISSNECIVIFRSIK